MPSRDWSSVDRQRRAQGKESLKEAFSRHRSGNGVYDRLPEIARIVGLHRVHLLLER